MKKLSKALFALMLAFLVALTACSSNQGSSSPASSGGDKANDSDPVTLTYFLWGNDNEIQLTNSIIAKFNEKYPNIKIEIERSTGDYFQTLKTKFAGKNEPDIFLMEPGEVGSFLKDGLLANLSEYLKSSSAFKDSDLWPVNDIYKYDGQKMGSGPLYAIIKDWSPDYMMVYNKKLFDQAGIAYPDPNTPMTWDEFLTTAKKLTKRDANGNIQVYGTDMASTPYKHIYEYLQMTGGSLYSEDGKKSNILDSKLRPAFEYFVNLQSGKDAPAQYTSGTTTGDPGARFAAGQVAVTWYGLWAYSSYSWDLSGFDIGFAPPPVMKKGDPKLAISSGLVSHAISANCINADAAWKFIEFYMTEGQKILAQNSFNIPGNKTVANNEFLNTGSDAVNARNKYFIDAATSYTQPIPVNLYVPQSRFDSIMSKEFTMIFEGKQTLDQALSNCDKQINDVISQNSDK